MLYASVYPVRVDSYVDGCEKLTLWSSQDDVSYEVHQNDSLFSLSKLNSVK